MGCLEAVPFSGLTHLISQPNWTCSKIKPEKVPPQKMPKNEKSPYFSKFHLFLFSNFRTYVFSLKKPFDILIMENKC